MEGAFSESSHIELIVCSLLPKGCQTSDAPVVVGNEAGGTVEQQQSVIDIVTDPSTGNVLIENGGMASSAVNLGGGSFIEGIARFIAKFLSLFFPQHSNNTSDVVDAATTTSGGSGNIGGDSSGTPVWTWLRRKFYSIWILLGNREMNSLKTGSFALSLLSYFLDKQLSNEDIIYLKVALWCGVVAFLIAPMSVPDVNAPLLAQARQAFARLTLIIGVLVAMVTALDDKKFRWLILLLFSIFFLICLCVEKVKEEEEDEGGGGGGS